MKTHEWVLLFALIGASCMPTADSDGGPQVGEPDVDASDGGSPDGDLSDVDLSDVDPPDARPLPECEEGVFTVDDFPAEDIEFCHYKPRESCETDDDCPPLRVEELGCGEGEGEDEPEIVIIEQTCARWPPSDPLGCFALRILPYDNEDALGIGKVCAQNFDGSGVAIDLFISGFHTGNGNCGQ